MSIDPYNRLVSFWNLPIKPPIKGSSGVPLGEPSNKKSFKKLFRSWELLTLYRADMNNENDQDLMVKLHRFKHEKDLCRWILFRIVLISRFVPGSSRVPVNIHSMRISSSTGKFQTKIWLRLEGGSDLNTDRTFNDKCQRNHLNVSGWLRGEHTY